MTRRDLLAVPFVYKAARPGYRYEFPRDHFNHPGFRTEWWYYTGNLTAQDRREFGYELTFFRQAIRRDAKEDSPWAVDDVYLAHLALSQIRETKFRHLERLNRSGPGIAGVAEPRVWNGNWEVKWAGDRQQLRAVTDEFSLALDLRSEKPPVIHGENGISKKSSGQDEASHYISFTRLLTSGRLTLEGNDIEVFGSSWMDHEFFSHSLGGDLQGWDWFSLQFDDNTELMLYRLRAQDGTATPFSSGTFVDLRGVARHLKLKDFSLEPLRRWRSAATKANYPLDWRARVPSLGIDIELKAAMDNQELVSTSKFSPTYWEGAIRIAGTRRGVGYLEMTGYDKGVNINGGH